MVTPDASRIASPVPVWRTRLDLLETAPDGVMVTDGLARILGANAELCRLCGYTRERLPTLSMADLEASEPPQAASQRVAQMLANGNERFRSRWRRADGGVIDVDVSTLVDRDDASITLFVRDISEAVQLQLKLERSRAFLDFLSRANALVARSEDLLLMYNRLCRLAAAIDPRIALAWIGLVDPASGRVAVAAQAGRASHYLDGIHISIDPEPPEGQGPTACAIRENRLVVVNRFATDPLTAPWHARASQHGIAAGAAVPFGRQGVARGALMLYSTEADTFDDELAQLIGELGANLSHAIDYFEQRGERQRAEEKLRYQAERGMALIRFAEKSAVLDETELLTYGLEEAERLTQSEMGFLHFVNDDQETLTLGLWTAKALTQCQAAHDNHYPISQAGIWADAFRQRRPVVINDYRAAASANGLPEGHAELRRLVSLPLIEDGKVQIIAGVGNKRAAYDADDVDFVQLMLADLWRIVQRTRAERALRVALNTVESTLAHERYLKHQIEQAHSQLLQSEKLASIGQLAAGVAHELNNPIGFVHSNLGSLEGYLKDIFEITEAYEQAVRKTAKKDDIGRIEALKRDKDFDFVRQDIDHLMQESRDGLQRVRKIVQDLKDFSRVGETDWQWADIHAGLDSTLNIVWNELKYKCTLVKHYAADLPKIHCLPSQLNQVFMNLLVNAAHAIETKGEITISTARLGEDAIQVSIADTGKGIPAENLSRIFEPFFTTKPVGKGTGLGLSLAWGIIAKHHGKIEVASSVGVGTTFTLTLAVDPAIDAAADAAATVAPAPTP